MIDAANEKSTHITRVTFKDEELQPVVPNVAYYSIIDIGSGQEIKAATEIDLGSPAASQADIRWQESDTSILNSLNYYETRLLTIWWLYGSDSPQNQGTEEVFLNIKNLHRIGS